MKMHDFEKELMSLINKHSLENGSNTPDFILAEYLKDCLLTFNIYIKKREKWYGREEDEFTPNETERDFEIIKGSVEKFKKYKYAPPPNDEEIKKDIEAIDKEFGVFRKEKLKNIKIIQSADIEQDKIYYMNPRTYKKLIDAGIINGEYIIGCDND